MPTLITEKIFKERTGFEPMQDDMERATCPDAGEIGHVFCGWCMIHDKPRFVCGCMLDRPVKTGQNRPDKIGA